MNDIKNEIIDYLSKRKFLTLATSTQNGDPLTHPIAYVNKEQNVYFSTDKNTRKAKNIGKNPNVAYSIYDNTEHLDEIKSIQMQGKATQVIDEKECKEIIQMLHKKFPLMTKIPIDSDSIIIKINPKTCFFSDYTKRFGYMEKVEY